VAKVDYFVPNESEAETIAGRPVRTIEEAKNCAAFFLEQGIPRVILTLGSNGALFATPAKTELIPAFPVQTKDTTGAGDAFIGSFAEFLAEGISEKESIARACLYAALSTTKVGTQKSFLSRTEFEARRRERAKV
jgi:ribokinase